MQPSSRASLAISLSGELDLQTAPAVRDELLAIASTAHGPELVLDLADVEFMDSHGLQPLVDAQRVLRQRGRSLRLRTVSRPVVRLIRAAGLAGTFNLLDVAPSGVGQRSHP